MRPVVSREIKCHAAKFLEQVGASSVSGKTSLLENLPRSRFAFSTPGRLASNESAFYSGNGRRIDPRVVQPGE